MRHAKESAARTVIRLADYQPCSHLPGELHLSFDLGLKETLVTSRFQFRRNPAAHAPQPLMLHGDGLNLVSASLDGHPLSADAYSATPDAFTLHLPPESGELSLTVRIHPDQNTELMGLYASRGGLYTQCESQGFRRITYFFDRPDVLTTYRVTLRANAQDFPVLLSNGNLVQESLSGDLRTAEWHDPFPKPCYLFALVAAKLDKIESHHTTPSGQTKLLQVYTKPEDLTRAQFALKSLERSVRWDEARFGLELDLERFMIVAVPDFNSGAMENKGLNLFNTKFVLADPLTATDRDYELVEAVIGHEYFHNWTGNRITCRDWFQLTLKEGLTVLRDQEFTADMLAEGLSPEQAASARAVKRIEDVRVLRAQQFPEDAGPMAHPIRPQAYEEIRNFYTATVYEKGAEVIRMLLTLFGVAGFRKGMDLYFQRHDGTAATCEDFVSSILDANDRADLFEQWMRWYDTPGTPKLSIDQRWNAQTGLLSLTLSQTLDPRSPQQAPLAIPVALGLLSSEGKVLSGLPELVLLQTPEQTLEVNLPELIGAPEPVVSALRNFSAPVLVQQHLSPEALQVLARFDPDAFNRWDACQRLIQDQLMPQPVAGPERLLETLASLLSDAHLSPAFQALALSLPSEGVVAEAWTQAGHAVDPLVIHQKSEALRRAMAQALHQQLLALDAQIDLDQTTEAQGSKPYSPDPLSAGRRSLQHLAQGLINRVAPLTERRRQLLARLTHCQHMTGRMAHLQGLIYLGGPESEEGLRWFADAASDNPLAMDKWFSAQASACRREDPGCDQNLPVIESLLAHPSYDPSNPNRVRSVLGAYFMQNPAGFHRADGKGYALWADQLGALDARNSQLAARLARSLDRWGIYESNRKKMMGQAIQQLAQRPGLSSDAAEVCGRLLSSK